MSQFEATLLRRIRGMAGQLTSLAKSYAPSHLQAGISTSVEEKQSGNIRIKITARGADAHAQEYGSGLRVDRRVGSPHKYTIAPKNGGKYLAFNWEVANNNPERFSFLPDGRVILPSVQHPGIEKYKGRGYLAPAVRDFRNKIKSKDVTDELKRSILSDIKKAFETGSEE